MFEQLQNQQLKPVSVKVANVSDRINRQYDDPYLAFQKEAIQNSWDARKDKKAGADWVIKFYASEDGGKTHIVVEDFGTTGMDASRFNSFISLWDPQKGQDDAGGLGQGKYVLMNASKEDAMLVESVAEDGTYRNAYLKGGEYAETVPWNDQLGHTGTRIWIIDAKRDFLKTLRSNKFEKSIVECWWQILEERFRGEVHLFDKQVWPIDLPNPVQIVTKLKKHQVKGFGKIKRLEIGFYERKVPDVYDGISVQRANMMVRKIQIPVHSENYKGKFWGYIEFEKDLEGELKGVEKSDHCGFLNQSPWSEVKKLVDTEISKFVDAIVPSQKQQRISSKLESDIIRKTNQIIHDNCPEIIGSGGASVVDIPKKPPEPIRIDTFSVQPSQVKWGDTVKPRCSIKNDTDRDVKVSLDVSITNFESGIKIGGEKHRFKIKSGGTKLVPLAQLKLYKSSFDKGRYTLRATLQEQKHSHDIDVKRTNFYLETVRESVQKGFIKSVEFYDGQGSWARNGPISETGVIRINITHADCHNIRNEFKKHKRILDKQLLYYILKIVIDEATKRLLQMELEGKQSHDAGDIVREVMEKRDRMYSEAYG